MEVQKFDLYIIILLCSIELDIVEGRSILYSSTLHIKASWAIIYK